MYYIDTPPPTISGNLHIGHIFSYTHIDLVKRTLDYFGKKVNYPIGFDCNGIPTERLLSKNSDRNVEYYIGQYISLFKKMNFSMNFQDYYRTDNVFENHIRENFSKLAPFIYKGTKDVYYDTALKTSISKSEVEETPDGLFGEVSKARVIRKTEEHIFLKILDKKDLLLELSEKIKFHPEIMKKKLIDWIIQLDEDWCISRNRNFGVQIPNTDYVFDTWFISAFTHRLFSKKSNYRFQSHEIIRSWTFYSLVISMLLENDIPFDEVFISGWCTAKDGQKLSKSKGNYTDPNVIIDNYGVNPIRFWCAKARWGTDTVFDENVVKSGKRLINKIKNAHKFFAIKNINEQEFLEGFLEDIENFLLKNDFATAIDFLYSRFFEFCSDDIEKCKKLESNNLFCKQAYGKLIKFTKLFEIYFPNLEY